MDLLSIATYLTTFDDQKYRITGSNKNVFLYKMPYSVVPGVLFRDSYMGTAIDHYLPGFYKAEFQVIVRHTDHVLGRAMADEISGFLTVKKSGIIGNMNVRQVLPRNMPLVFPASEGDLLEWSIHFDAAYSV
jgi:hypothetical protein